jgi:hypothetical protein
MIGAFFVEEKLGDVSGFQKMMGLIKTILSFLGRIEFYDRNLNL